MADKMQRRYQPFCKRVEQFIMSLNQDQQTSDQLRTEIVRLVLHVQSGQGSQTIRKLFKQIDMLEEFNFFKNQYLDCSFEIHRKLWFAVCKFLQTGKSPQYALMKDVKYCLSALTAEDLEKLKVKTLNKKLNVDHIDIASWQIGKKVKRNLFYNAKAKAGTLSYISKYDPALDIEDFSQDLLCETVRVFNVYQRSTKTPEKIIPTAKTCTVKDCSHKPFSGDVCKYHHVENEVQKYVEVCLNNKVNNIKEYYNCTKRKRIAGTNQTIYRKRNRIKNEIQKNKKMGQSCDHLEKELQSLNQSIQMENNDYYSIVTSFTWDTSDDSKCSGTIEPSPECAYDEAVLKYGNDVSIETALWLESINEKVDPDVLRFINIVLGGQDNEFEEWASHKGVNLEKFTSLVKGARQYLKINPKELRQNKYLKDFLASNRSL
jgi:hypothetical protein